MDQTRLLKDLRGQVTALEADLRERSESVEEYQSSLKAEYAAARQAQRIAATYTAWRDERITQIAVAWVLATVFVRFCEDNGLIESAWIAGPGERVREAEDRHNAHFQQHPEQNDRDWLIAAIRYLASTNETVAGLFDEAHNPLWEMDPSYEAATALLTFWRRLTSDGEIVHDFTDPDWNTRFLGDLYQNLSESARKTYALLQTPEFVEEFILDMTLEPAVKEFGLSPEWRYRPSKRPDPAGEMPTGLRTIDPACGSGHFVLGIFHRLLEKWKQAEPGTDRWELIRRALESVHGCDKNPFAVAIARFRLLLAALRGAGETRLDQAPIFPINIAVGDSLLHGRGAESVTNDLFATSSPFTYSTEDVYEFAAQCDLLGKGSYHAVVGNPPYITVKDNQEKQNYRVYESCAGAYALSVPFAQRIFELAIRTGGADRKAGYTGQITANSFMKREFGKKLIHWLSKSINLTHVIDTSGAYIPGHGTPTVILVGRNRMASQGEPIRAALGVRGEPFTPSNAATGFVWSAITKQIDRIDSESQWISVENIERTKLSRHPWSLNGGGAGDLQKNIETNACSVLSKNVATIGFGATTKEDEAFIVGSGTLQRAKISPKYRRPLVEGNIVRDYTINKPVISLWPYTQDTLTASAPKQVADFLWPLRSQLQRRTVFGRTQLDRDLEWFEYAEFAKSRYRILLSIVYAEVATHNHFVLDRGGKIFKQTAPVIKLPVNSPEDEHLALLGLLNSSTACFWLKQVSHNKGSQGVNEGFKSQEWERFYQFNSTRLQDFPIPATLPLRLGTQLDDLAQKLPHDTPETITGLRVPTRDDLNAARTRYNSTRNRMIAAQEELDWQVYGLFEILSKDETEASTIGDLKAIPDVNIGERAFEIFLARKVEAGDDDGEWFTRHSSTPITQIPLRWPEEYRRVVQARIDFIEKRRDINLIERPEYKRRWALEQWEKREQAALHSWLLARCEQEDIWFGLRDGLRHPRPLTVSQLADQFRADEDMQSVAALYASDHLGKRDLPLAKVLEEVIKDEHVPYLAALRYKDSGLSKRTDWEHVWEEQREEDRTGKRLDIAVPPKYASADFKKPSYWSHRGKLDVPKERFVSYPDASPDADDTLLLGWAGWDHKDQAQALVNLVNDRTEQAAWETERLTPLLAGLLEVMPWVHQWHGEFDADWEGVPAEEFQAFLDDQRGKHRLSEEQLRAWRPAAGRGRKKRS